MILVDSSVWIEYFNSRDTAHTRKVDEIIGSVEIVVIDLVLTEVLQGFRAAKDFDSALKLFDSFRFAKTGDRATAIQAARNYIYLRSLGVTIRKTVDAVIATKCIMNGFTLLHNDRDFLPFEKHLGLKCVLTTDH